MGLTSSEAAEVTAQEQHSLVHSIVLHLLPGALLFAFVLASAAFGVEPVLALLAGIVLVVAPVELAILLFAARRATGRWSVSAVVSYGDPMPLRRLVRLAFPLVTWFAFCLVLSVALLDSRIADALFSWYPESIRQFGSTEGGGSYPTWVLVAFFALAFAINGLLGPIVEELYFRGYLLPRLSRFGRGAAVLNAVLFSLYHLWTPWQNPGRIAGLLPWVLTVQRTRSLRLSLAVHISVNTLFLLGMIGAVR